MQTSTAFFAGAGTVAVAVVVGLSGGMLVANLMSPKTSGQEVAKLERRTAPQSQPAPSAQPNSYLAATEAASKAPVVVEKAPSPPQSAAEQAQPSPAPSPAAIAAAPQPTNPAPPTASSAATGPAQSKMSEPALAKARDSDVKARDGDQKVRDADSKTRDSDLKSSDSEPKAADNEVKASESDRSRSARRHSERRQHWAERRRTQRPREPDMRDVEQAVREDSSPRTYVVGPVGMDTPRIRLFDGD
jgi:hypothetical protein